MLCNFLQAFLRCAEALLALKTERPRDHRNRQDTHFASHFGDDWCRTGPGTAAHAGCYKDHIRAVQRVSDAIFIFKCRRTTHFRVGARTEALGDARAQLQHGLGMNIG